LQRLGVRKKGVDIGRLLKAGKDGKPPVPQLSAEVVERLQALLRQAVPVKAPAPSLLPQPGSC
jgi:hypothetical protein